MQTAHYTVTFRATRPGGSIKRVCRSCASPICTGGHVPPPPSKTCERPWKGEDRRMVMHRTRLPAARVCKDMSCKAARLHKQPENSTSQSDGSIGGGGGGDNGGVDHQTRLVVGKYGHHTDHLGLQPYRPPDLDHALKQTDPFASCIPFAYHNIFYSPLVHNRPQIFPKFARRAHLGKSAVTETHSFTQPDQQPQSQPNHTEPHTVTQTPTWRARGRAFKKRRS